MIMVAQCLYSPKADYVGKCEMSDRIFSEAWSAGRKGVSGSSGWVMAGLKPPLDVFWISCPEQPSTLLQQYASEEQLDNPFALIDFCKAFCQMPNNKAPDK